MSLFVFYTYCKGTFIFRNLFLGMTVSKLKEMLIMWFQSLYCIEKDNEVLRSNLFSGRTDGTQTLTTPSLTTAKQGFSNIKVLFSLI